MTTSPPGTGSSRILDQGPNARALYSTQGVSSLRSTEEKPFPRELRDLCVNYSGEKTNSSNH